MIQAIETWTGTAPASWDETVCRLGGRCFKVAYGQNFKKDAKYSANFSACP